MFDGVYSSEDLRKFFDTTGEPSDASEMAEQSYNNISDVRITGGDAFDIPDSLWPVIQGRRIIYKDFDELSPREQREALGVGLKLLKFF